MIRPADAAWMAAALVTVAAILFWNGPRGTERSNSYSAYAEGKKALVLLLGGLGRTASRNESSFAFLAAQLKPDDTLCLLGPARPLLESEWRELNRWVAGGGHLLIAMNDERPWPNIADREFSVEPREESAELQKKLPLSVSLPVTGEFAWRSSWTLNIDDADVLIEQDEAVQAARLSYGSGTVTVVADDWIFSNLGLAIADNPLLAVSLLDGSRTGNARLGSVIVDESLNLTGTPKIVTILFRPPLLMLSLTLILAIVLYGWWESHRFGPLQPSPDAARQNIVEHVRAVGNLYWKARDSRPMLQHYWQWFARQWNLRSRSDHHLERLARRSGTDPAHVRKLVDQVRVLLDDESSKPSRRRVASLIRELSRIGAAAAHSPERSTS